MAIAGKILLVEDEEILRDIYVMTLQGEGYVVEVARDGNEAESMMRVGGYDLVLMDLMLPGKDGMQVLKDLQGSTPEKPNKAIVYMTNMAQENVLKGEKDYGVKGILIKSEMTPGEMLTKVKEYLELDKN